MSFKPSISFNLAWLWVSAAVFVFALILPPNKFWPTLAVVGLALAGLIFLALAVVGALFVALVVGTYRERQAEARRQAIADLLEQISGEDWPDEIGIKDSAEKGN